MSGPKLSVGQDTQLLHLQNFALKLGDDQDVHAKQGKNGEVILYARTEKRGVSKLLHNVRNAGSGSAARKRQLARETVSKILAKAGPSADNASLSSVKAALDPAHCERLKGASLKILSTAAQPSAPKEAGVDIDAKLTGAIVDQTLDDIGLVFSEGTNTAPHDAVANLGDHKAAFEKTSLAHGARIAADINKQGKTEAEIRSFVVKGSPALEKKLLEQVSEELVQTYDNKDHLKLIKDLTLDSVVAARQLMAGGRIVGETSVAAKGGQMMTVGREVHSNGVIYGQPTVLGVGGYGAVIRYSTDDGQHIAVKMALKTGDDALEAMLKEATAHADISGHENVIGFKGIVVDDSGRPGIVMELASNGDLPDLLGKLLPKNPAKESPTDRAARHDRTLLLAQEIIGGMSHVNEDAEYVHSDMKTPNIFIGEGFHIKLADPGLAEKLSNFSLSRVAAHNMTADYNAPEFFRAMKSVAEAEDTFTESSDTGGLKPSAQVIKSVSDQVDTAFSKSLPNEHRKTLRSAVDDRFFGVVGDATVLNTRKLAVANETWAVGAIIHEMVFGKTPFKSNITEYDKFSVGQVAVGDGPPPGVFSKSSGNAQLDDLLNKLLHPDPAQRPALSTVRDHPAFAGLASREADIRKQLAALV